MYHVTQRLVLHVVCMNVFLVMPSVCVNACLQVSLPFAWLGRPAKFAGRQSEWQLALSLRIAATCTVAMVTDDVPIDLVRELLSPLPTKRRAATTRYWYLAKELRSHRTDQVSKEDYF